MRRILFALLALGLLAAVPTAHADTTWTRITAASAEPVFGQPLNWMADGASVTGVWIVPTGNTHTLEVVRFTPSRAAEAGSLVTSRPATTANWDFMDATVLPAPAGGVQAIVTGQFGTQSGPPTGTNLVPIASDASIGALQLLGSSTPDMLSAVLTPTGPLWAGNAGSTIYSYLPAAQPAFQFTGIGRPIGGCCGYNPRLGFDRAGRLWMALYSNTTGQTGIYMVQLDPATGAPLGDMLLAPQSQPSDNNNYRIAFACHDICRVAYEESTTNLVLSSGRIVTWAPGEAAPTAAGGTAGGDVANPAMAIRADGRVWVAWVDRPTKRVVATLGNARGGGGRTVDAGRPPLPDELSNLYGLEALPLGDDVLLNSNAGVGADAQAQYVNVVLPPGAVDTSGVPNPRVVTSPGGKIVFPGKVDAGDLGPGRCVRVKPVADKPARIWAQIFSGRRNGTAFSNRVAFRFTGPGAKSKCVKLVKRPAGFYRGKVFRIKFEVRTGANAKPAERTRPPWRTQPGITIDA